MSFYRLSILSVSAMSAVSASAAVGDLFNIKTRSYCGSVSYASNAAHLIATDDRSHVGVLLCAATGQCRVVYHQRSAKPLQLSWTDSQTLTIAGSGTLVKEYEPRKTTLRVHVANRMGVGKNSLFYKQSQCRKSPPIVRSARS